jgi:hypothetical protein
MSRENIVRRGNIIKTMARGWESKSIEAQQAEAEQGKPKSRVRLSPSEAIRARQKGNLNLSRQQILQQLQAALNPRHRELLNRALADVEQKLSEFGD